MLVLSRKLNESIQIGSDITLTITRVQGGRVQVGIEAPREVVIRRSEIAGVAVATDPTSGNGDAAKAALRKSA